MKRITAFLLTAWLLIVPAFCAEEQTAKDVFEEFIASHGLDSSNFSMVYYEPGDGELYMYNERTHFIAGSTYKLALNMYMVDLIHAGELNWTDMIGENSLAAIHRESLVNSNNDLSMDFVHYLMGANPFSYYRGLVERYADMDDLPHIYYADNYVCAEYLYKTARYLYEHSEDYPSVLMYMEQAQQDAYIALYNSAYPVAHKYGWFDGAVNDVGIVYTSSPYILVVMTYNVDSAEELVSLLAAAATEYNLAKNEESAEPALPVNDTVVDEGEPKEAPQVTEERPVPENTEDKISPDEPEKEASPAIEEPVAVPGDAHRMSPSALILPSVSAALIVLSVLFLAGHHRKDKRVKSGGRHKR